MALEDLKGKRIAIPGKLTTAYLTLRLMQPDFEAVVVPFDQILDAVRDGAADAGLVIHEAQLTYAAERIPYRGRPGPLVEGHIRFALAAGRERPAPGSELRKSPAKAAA